MTEENAQEGRWRIVNSVRVKSPHNLRKGARDEVQTSSNMFATHDRSESAPSTRSLGVRRQDSTLNMSEGHSKLDLADAKKMKKYCSRGHTHRVAKWAMVSISE